MHEACLDLYKQCLRGRLAASSHSVDKLCTDTDERLAKEFDELLSPDYEAFNVKDAIEKLNGHYGALDSFKWVEHDQIRPRIGSDAFVYDASCSNRVSCIFCMNQHN